MIEGNFLERSTLIATAQTYLRRRVHLDSTTSLAKRGRAVRDIAIGYLAAGVNIIPLRLD